MRLNKSLKLQSTVLDWIAQHRISAGQRAVRTYADPPRRRRRGRGDSRW